MFRRQAKPGAPLADDAGAVTVPASAGCAAAPCETRRIELSGRVQGVGFRPFVYRLAQALGVAGSVQNRLGTVRVIAQGTRETLDTFQRRLLADAPPLARPALDTVARIDAAAQAGFRIEASVATEQARIVVPPDHFLCAECAAEQRDPGDRRYRYPFINCTQCGPRYTLIENLPYDRANTSMAGFPLCADCRREYADPLDRRFHAEPLACPVCGPQVSYTTAAAPGALHAEQAIAAAVATLRAGRVLAVKGIGGYHLLCDAASNAAVTRLRRRKQRPDKPLAVMFSGHGAAGLGAVARCVVLDADSAERLADPARPIVLAAKREGAGLAAAIAPGLAELGVFLAYSPLHQLLLDDFGGPLVATSGNVSGEPVLTDNVEAELRLAAVADAFLHHDRPIVRPADDSVLRRIGGRVRPLRLGRGHAPLEITLPTPQREPVLCLGGHLKGTVTLSWGTRAIVSPHIGDMGSPRSLAVLEKTVDDLQRLYQVRAVRILCDAHRGYATNRWARRAQPLPVATVWHHRAHAAALAAETGLPGPWLVFTWDGVGLGEDGTLWGGEALLGDCGNWRRVASLRSFRPPGGERAGREPWRSAAALLWEAGRDWRPPQDRSSLAQNAWASGLNCPATSAAGRLFDAAAALVCGTDRVTFEAQGPMQLEALCRQAGQARGLPLAADAQGILRSDWLPLLALLQDDRVPAAARAEAFHSSMARVVVDQAKAIRARHALRRVGLAGGVFQNRVLSAQTIEGLERAGFEVHMGRLLPCNDAALSFGQAAEWAARGAPPDRARDGR